MLTTLTKGFLKKKKYSEGWCRTAKANYEVGTISEKDRIKFMVVGKEYITYQLLDASPACTTLFISSQQKTRGSHLLEYTHARSLNKPSPISQLPSCIQLNHVATVRNGVFRVLFSSKFFNEDVGWPRIMHLPAWSSSIFTPPLLLNKWIYLHLRTVILQEIPRGTFKMRMEEPKLASPLFQHGWW